MQHTHFLHRLTITSLGIAAMLVPSIAVAQAQPHEQDFVITAYYSPLPDQCCYVKGSFEADKILNGNGTHGADGTAVYPGMLAAPKSYAFGTRVRLPGIGTLTVHDRGGAIIEGADSHRLDIWMGSGEEGLARALAFGVQRVRGTVHPPSATHIPESFALDSFQAPTNQLKPYLIADAGMLDVHPSAGQRGLSVSLLQERLKTLGYFQHEVTGLFGEVTQKSLEAFLRDMKLSEPSDHLTQTAAAYLEAAIQVQTDASPVAFVSKDSGKSDIMAAQRTLRHLGYYRGRTDGKYSSTVFNAILSYQRDQRLASTATSPGAGRIGPLTKGAIDREIRRRRIARRAKILLAYDRIRDLLEEKRLLMQATLKQGISGTDVSLLQKFLASQGFFPADKINGHFGPLTQESVAKYQVARELLPSLDAKNAGTVGPVTLKTMRQETVKEVYKVVKGYGWEAL